MTYLSTWLGVVTYINQKSSRIDLLKPSRVWRGFVATQQQRPRQRSSWLVLRPPASCTAA